MKMKFNSEVLIENIPGNIFFKVFGVLLGTLVISSIGIKILAGDFSISDMVCILIGILIIWCSVNSSGTPQFFPALCELEFEPDKMIISYKDVDSGKKVGLYSETTTIQYDSIKNIEYVKESDCFTIEAGCLTKHTYMQPKNMKPVSNSEEEPETFIYVMDSDVIPDILNNFEKYTGRAVKVIDMET